VNEPPQIPDSYRVSSISARRSVAVPDVQSPLGFYVYFMSVVELLIGPVAIWAPLSELPRIIFIGLALALAAAIAGAVFYLVIRHPSSLVYSEWAHLRALELQKYGSASQPLPANVLDALTPVAQPEAPTGQLTQASEGS
jgi:hypothetical protein